MDKEIKNDDIKVEIQRKENCVVEMHVFASKNLAMKARKQAIKELQKEISISGFRKGKAPEYLIIKQKQTQLEENWKKHLGNLCFIEAEKLTKVFPLSQNTRINYNLKNISEEGAEATFSFETEPQIPEIDPNKFTLKELKTRNIEEKDVDEVIRQSQFFYATWKEIQRPIKENDYVILDLISLDTNQKVFSDTRFEVKDKSIAKWMKDALIGKKKDDVLETISKPDKELPEEEKKQFEPKKVKIIIKKVEEVNLPKLDDDFAKKMGKNNVEELKTSIKDMLEKRNEETILKEKREQVSRFLVETYVIDLPLSLVEAERTYRKNNILSNPKLKTLFKNMKEEEKIKFEENVKKDSKDAISIFYLTRKIIKDAKIEIPLKEIDEESIKIFQKEEVPSKESSKTIPSKYKAMAFSKLYLQKAQDYILNFHKKTS